MAGIIRATVIGLALCIPIPAIAMSKRRLSWVTAVLLGTYLVTVSLILIAEVPSRILYYFDARHGDWAEQYRLLRFMKGADTTGGLNWYKVVRDIAANTVQGIFFGAIVFATYRWGERQRKAGRFRT
jgi:hypothetical protein